VNANLTGWYPRACGPLSAEKEVKKPADGKVSDVKPEAKPEE
jgi:hypothetical protein